MPRHEEDPYVYPDTAVLINKFNIQDGTKLQELEGILFAVQSSEPLPEGKFDYCSLKAIHHHLLMMFMAGRVKSGLSIWPKGIVILRMLSTLLLAWIQFLTNYKKIIIYAA